MDDDDKLVRDKYLNKNFLNKTTIDRLAKAITYYAFRGGPIEDMHANKQFSQDDMAQLNKYMVDKIASLLLAIKKEKWTKINNLLAFSALYTGDWDPAEPSTKDFDFVGKKIF
jgi:hypothetical protein